MALPLFVYGTLRDRELLEVVSGRDALSLGTRPAELPDHAVLRVRDEDYPMLVPRPGARARGLLVDGLDHDALARLCFYEGAHLYALTRCSVVCDGAAVAAEAFFPLEEDFADAGPWHLDAWRLSDRGLAAEAAREVMAWYGRRPPEDVFAGYATMRMRALARLEGRASTVPAVLRRGLGQGDTSSEALERPYADYFAIESHTLRHRRFDGRMSPPIRRAVFVTGDAVTVLPYDPERDCVLLVEQFRAGPFARADARPWLLEAVAGRRDPGESYEDAARRELREEAGIEAGRLLRVAGYYPSPGAVSEYIISYVALCDLGAAGGVFGVAGEHEDIRAFVVPFSELERAAEAGEIENGPLLVSFLWLGARRRALAG